MTSPAPSEPASRTWSASEERALRVWVALARSHTTVVRAVTNRISEYGLTTSQFAVLEALHHLGPLPLGELAGKLLVTGGNVTYVVDRLQREGLVQRERSSEDRRVIRAVLTPRGREKMEQVFPDHAAFIGDLLAVLEPDEQAELRRLLKKLGKAIQASETGADSA